MKKIFTGIFLLLNCYLFAQNHNLSGWWIGSIKPKGELEQKFKLKFVLLDSCTTIYRVHQYEYDESKTHVSYNIIQIQDSILIRDNFYFKNYTNETESAEARMNFNGKVITGIRYVLSDNEYIKLYPTFSVNQIFKCRISKTPSLLETQNCFSVKDTELISNMFLITDSSIVVLKIKDDDIQDGDKMSLFVGKKKILDNVVQFSKFNYEIPLSITSDTTVTWCACNTGESEYNTGELIFEEYNNSELIQTKTIPVYLKSNQKVSVLIRKK